MFSGKTKCQLMRAASFKIPGRLTPRCNPDGTFASKQCDYKPDVITCWKVDLKGRKISRNTYFFLAGKGTTTTPIPSTVSPKGEVYSL